MPKNIQVKEEIDTKIDNTDKHIDNKKDIKDAKEVKDLKPNIKNQTKPKK
jgi:hypothetical protein